MQKKTQEVEVKLAMPDVGSARKRVKAGGFRVSRARVLETNLVLDDAAGSIRESGLLLRLRRAGKRITFTFKGKEIAGRHKRREEREFHPDDFDSCLAVFAGLGYTPRYSYEKYRTEYVKAGEGAVTGVVTIDETPIGVFLELEGAAKWIDATAKELGFSRNDYITASYATLYADWCREYGVESNAMTFGELADMELD